MSEGIKSSSKLKKRNFSINIYAELWQKNSSGSCQLANDGKIDNDEFITELNIIVHVYVN